VSGIKIQILPRGAAIHLDKGLVKPGICIKAVFEHYIDGFTAFSDFGQSMVKASF
jgi:hypothetical protein